MDIILKFWDAEIFENTIKFIGLAIIIILIFNFRNIKENKVFLDIKSIRTIVIISLIVSILIFLYRTDSGMRNFLSGQGSKIENRIEKEDTKNVKK